MLNNLLWYLATCMAKPDVVPVPSGVVVTQTEDVRNVNAYATIYVALDHPTMELGGLCEDTLNRVNDLANTTLGGTGFNLIQLHFFRRIDILKSRL